MTDAATRRSATAPSCRSRTAELARVGPPDDGLTEADCEWLLRERLRQNLADFAGSWPPYYDQPFRVQVALADMAYQLDHRLLEFTTMLALIERGDYAAAADDALGTAWAREVPGRARSVTALIRSAAR